MLELPGKHLIRAPNCSNVWNPWYQRQSVMQTESYLKSNTYLLLPIQPVFYSCSKDEVEIKTALKEYEKELDGLLHQIEKEYKTTFPKGKFSRSIQPDFKNTVSKDLNNESNRSWWKHRQIFSSLFGAEFVQRYEDIQQRIFALYPYFVFEDEFKVVAELKNNGIELTKVDEVPPGVSHSQRKELLGKTLEYTLVITTFKSFFNDTCPDVKSFFTDTVLTYALRQDPKQRCLPNWCKVGERFTPTSPTSRGLKSHI